eukprot:TRINITY_DN8556_c0_g1_i2.p1 TRINITY_DN8556_c0_g1~~TRINITY_DN8556_c0_g1_i2.p1  ORF type:complete len:165 (-),score=36.38 TRINITY_DN8556_c0_g1_i2:609-1103(-)
MRLMLVRENELRLSPAIQARYEAAEREPELSWMNITEDLQKQVLREFNVTKSATRDDGGNDEEEEDVEWGLYNLRGASFLYPDEPDFKTIPLYVKYNRCRQGDLHVGMRVPHIPLVKVTPSGATTTITINTSLHDEMMTMTMVGAGAGLGAGGRPLVVIAGSYT